MARIGIPLGEHGDIQVSRQTLDGGKWRAIDLFEGDKLNERAFKALVRAAVDYNQSKVKKKSPVGKRVKAQKAKG